MKILSVLMPKSGTAVATPIGLNGDSDITISNESKSTDLILSSARNTSSMGPRRVATSFNGTLLFEAGTLIFNSHVWG